MQRSRRAFVQASLTAGLVHPLLATQSPRNPALSGGGFKLGIVTYNIAKDWDLATIIKNCEATGYEAVELRTTHKHGVEPTLSQAERAVVKQRFANTKVRCLSLGSVCEFHAPDPTTVRQNIDECKRFVELAHDIGALGVKVRPNGIPKDVPEEKTLAQIGKSLRECGEFAQSAGVEIWVEVHGAESQVPWRMRKMMEIAAHPHVGICWNSNPPDVENGSVKKSFDLLKPWLRNAHINELWKPEYPWRELFRLMKQAQYNRYCLIEIADNPDPLRLMRYYRALWLELCR